jgi:hypothetical protein
MLRKLGVQQNLRKDVIDGCPNSFRPHALSHSVYKLELIDLNFSESAFSLQKRSKAPKVHPHFPETQSRVQTCAASEESIREIFMSSICSATFVRVGSEVFKFVDTRFNSLNSLKLSDGVTKQEIMSLSTLPFPQFLNILQKLMNSAGSCCCTWERAARFL